MEILIVIFIIAVILIVLYLGVIILAMCGLVWGMEHRDELEASKQEILYGHNKKNDNNDKDILVDSQRPSTPGQEVRADV